MSDYKSLNFIEQIIEEDLANGLPKERLRFRFPPEPNGYLHIGHTKAIGINFGLGKKYNAPVNLRFDDTNPAKEEQEYVNAIKQDLTWLGYKWHNTFYSSDYFQQLYNWAILLIKDGKAYIDSQPSEAIAEQKGTPTQVGKNSPYRDRPVDENLALFQKMKEGIYPAGAHVLRAKIDMEDPNMLMRDPIMYRIMYAHHQRTANDWCIYPTYDWTHGESDYIEQISHSLCSLEFKPHRKLYNWFRDCVYNFNNRTLPIVPKQREFARLNLSYTIMSKRKLLRLVEEGHVTGWDDPRMPTISGLRRRGFTPSAIKEFIERVGVAKRDNVIDVSLLEFCIRENLNKTANRIMAVLDPLKIVLTNYPDHKEEWLKAENNPEDESAGFRSVPFSREIYIEKEDFREKAGVTFFRLKLGGEVRLKNAYIIKANTIVKNKEGNITEVHCTYDTNTSKRVKGTLQWVSIKHAITAKIKSYDRLFVNENPDSDNEKDFISFLNPNSLTVTTGYLEPSIAKAEPGNRFQFQRIGYFNTDDDSKQGALIFNKTVSLKDSWVKHPPNTQHSSSKCQSSEHQQKSPINVILKLGKKYTNLSEEKQQKAKTEIQELATKISYKELEPLLGTALKKVGTRIAAAIALKVLLKKGLKRNDTMNNFISKAKTDTNHCLALEVKNM